MQDAGLKLKFSKCKIGASQVEYLGHMIDKEGLHPTTKKVEAITKAPTPTNVTQLKAYLGLFNFYRRFITESATLLEPLNMLLRDKNSWKWTEAQERAFQDSKMALLNSQTLVHFDPALPVVVVADSSSYGVGGVLCHLIEGVERPVHFVSRTLTTTERKYAQVEKEALALVFAMRKFHNYLWGQEFTLITDHKPLLGIFDANKNIPQMASGRIQRWALILQCYKFTLKHRSGELLGTADALSRLPIKTSDEATPIPADWVQLVNFLESAPITSRDIKDATLKDPLLSKVYRFCQQGWPNSVHWDQELTPYTRRKEELSTQNGCILWGTRIIVPPKHRSDMIKELHDGHMGSSKMKELARSYVWWPNMDRDLEEVSKTCIDCLNARPAPPRAELHPWEWPSKPWHRIHIDYAGPIDGKYFLVVVDAYSKWVEIFPTTSTTTKETVACLQHAFALFGLPVTIVSDNGTCFTSAEFQAFVSARGIRHITSAPYHPATNGLAERMVQTFKGHLRKSNVPLRLALDQFLFNYRLTPHTTTGISPAELMMSRKLRCRLDLLSPFEAVQSKVLHKQGSQLKNHPGSRTVDIDPSSSVMVRDYSSHPRKWAPATVVKQSGPLSYKCELQGGGMVRRHQDQVIVGSPKNLQDRTMDSPIDNPNSPSEVFVPTNVTNSFSHLSPTGSVSTTAPIADPSPQVSSSPEMPMQLPTGNLPSTSSPRRSTRLRKPVERLNL